uniref:Uncharacterized protein n=1 Tax=viral metagenome TaxID=1070528 RepID=A0A6C0EMF1_9ZZZZ
MTDKNSYESQFLSKGVNNPKYVDLLEEDKPIAGQKYCCVSFVSPEKILKKKELFYFQEFLKHWDFTKSTEKFTQFLNFLSFKYNLNFDKIMVDFQEYAKSESDKLVKTTLDDDYKNFVDAKEETLEQDFNTTFDFQTSTRGIKIRGSYPTQQEAELRCRMLREVDPNHDVYVGPVGLWMPWNPEAYKTGRVEYLEDELNQLMSEKNLNETQAKIAFEKRVREAKRAAIAENVKIAQDSGNKLTQNIDSDGNLVGVANMNTTESGLNGEVSSADIRKELFEGANVRTRESDKAQEAAQEAAQEDKVDLEITEKKED